MNYFNTIREYLEKKPSLQCVPVIKKAPFMAGWQLLDISHDVIDSWEDQGVVCDGFGVRAGQHNIGWADIDTDDVEFNYRFNEIMDLPPICAKKGMKGKTVFFRFEGTPKKSKYNVFLRSGDKKPLFEFNFTSGQTVLPPSIHPDTGMPYKWISESLLDIDIDDLPIIDEQKIEYLETIIRASSLQEGLKSVPTGITGDGSGKYIAITREATKLLHMGFDEHSIAKTLVGYDRIHFPGNQFFFSSKIGRDLVSKDSDIENAVVWISSYKQSLMRTDPDLRKTLSSMAKISEAVKIHGDWELPKPIQNKAKIMEFPEHLFPQAFKQYCFDHSKLSALPPEAYLTALFSTFSATCQAKVTIHAMNGFLIHPSISTLIVAPSGSRKDAVFDVAMSPLRKIIDKQLDSIDSDFIEREKDICIKIEELSKRKRTSIKDGDNVLKDQLNAEIIDAQKDLVSIKKLRPNFIFESGTQEKLYELMAQNQDRGIFLTASEYVLLMGNLGKKGNESLRAFYLKLLNGSTTETFSHQTKTGTNVNIRKVVGCALVGAQTDVLGQDIREMEAGRNSDGLLQRFFIVNINPEIREMTNSLEAINSSRVDNLYCLMYNHPGHVDVFWDSEETRNAYIQYDFELRRKIQFEKSAIRSFRSKYSGKSVQLAWIYEIANASPGVIPNKISKKSFLLAVEFLEWLSANLDITWANINYQTAARTAEIILSCIHGGGVTGKSLQQSVMRMSHVSVLDFRLGVDILVDHGYLRITGGEYEINPN